MISSVFTLTNRDGIQVKVNDFTTDPSNFIALQEYPQFDVDVKHSEVDKEGQHGIWDNYSFYGKRVIQFSGVIIGQTEAAVEQLRKKLLQVVSLPAQPDTTRDGQVLVQWTDPQGAAWQIYAKLDRAVRFDRQMKRTRMLSFILTLKAASPTIESQTETTTQGTRGWGVGFKLSTKLPFKLYTYGNQLSVVNNGDFSAFPVIRLYGEPGGVTNPRIKSLTTGKTFKLNLTLQDATKWVEINAKTAAVLDQSGVDQSGLVDGASEYIHLVPGTNELVYLSNESEGATNPFLTGVVPQAIFTVKHRDTLL